MKSTLKNLAATSLLSLFAVFGSFQVAQAQDIVCTGKNLISQLKVDNPALAAKLAEKAKEQPFGSGTFFKVEKDGAKPSYIMGTMHVADPRITTLSASRTQALKNADIVALEIAEIIDDAKMATLSAQNMDKIMYLTGADLSKKLDAEQSKTVQALALEQGMPWSVASKMRPFFLMANLSIPACEKARQAKGMASLDKMLGNTAKNEGTPVIGLETFVGQLKAVGDLPEEMKLKSLVDSARLGDKLPDMFETMIDMYTTGETGLIWATMHAMGPDGFTDEENRTDYAEFQRVMIDKRNVTMADGSEPLIKKGNAFIAVGALHLPGEKGVLNILAQRGYKITLVQE